MQGLCNLLPLQISLQGHTVVILEGISGLCAPSPVGPQAWGEKTRFLVVNHKQKSACLAGAVWRFKMMALLHGCYDEHLLHHWKFAPFFCLIPGDHYFFCA